MLEDLEKLIIFIQKQYRRLYNEWKKTIYMSQYIKKKFW